MEAIPCLQVDAFTDQPFTGNPAAVCLLETERDAEWMQSVAAEMNLSETAFVHRLGALLPRSVLERAPRQEGADGVPGTD